MQMLSPSRKRNLEAEWLTSKKLVQENQAYIHMQLCIFNLKSQAYLRTQPKKLREFLLEWIPMNLYEVWNLLFNMVQFVTKP